MPYAKAIQEIDNSFTGYRWSYFSSLGEGPLLIRAQKFLQSTDWNALIEYAAAARNGTECRLLPDIGLGYNHVVRIIEFKDNVRWVARLRMPPLSQTGTHYDSARSIMECEYNTIQLVQKESNILDPQVYAFEGDPNCRINAQFMLMDCLKGNVGMDLNMKVPPEHKRSVFARLAEIHIEMSKIQLPMIGTIVGKNEDGSYRQGAIPGLGGPFERATEFFKAWAAKAEFGLSEDKLKKAAGSFANEVSSSGSSFKASINSLAERLSIRDGGPFPLCHGDFGHNNVVFNDKYHLLGVIDWESSFAAPWEIACEFPLTLSVVPPDMDVPWNYDATGRPKDAELQQNFADREDYIAMDSKRQYLATAMRLYQSGKPGWYSKVVERFLDGTEEQ
ncbi:hypothetical protein N7474_000758 [Penicillium riverlandense]|uniref:uncharacterized protein n=1 Tax=Penicillium riverlandense TaxID=1903569 RepID=UPI002546B2B6|nr:uncharacterized protein N7474_000758 [Penicillium riverlandense]KAJ5832447.1 hypothetical protein N7474_000758 [Penicillium riverlandense]